MLYLWEGWVSHHIADVKLFVPDLYFHQSSQQIFIGLVVCSKFSIVEVKTSHTEAKKYISPWCLRIQTWVQLAFAWGSFDALPHVFVHFEKWWSGSCQGGPSEAASLSTRLCWWWLHKSCTLIYISHFVRYSLYDNEYYSPCSYRLLFLMMTNHF